MIFQSPWGVIIGIWILGCIYNLYKIRIIVCELNFIYKFLDIARIAIKNKYSKHSDLYEENRFLLENTYKMSEILDKDIYHRTISFTEGISKSLGTPFNPMKAEAYFAFVQQEIGKKKEQYRSYWWDFLKPFILFYNGISCILAITVSPLIKKISPQFDTENKWYNFVFTILGVISSIITILQYCKFI